MIDGWKLTGLRRVFDPEAAAFQDTDSFELMLPGDPESGVRRASTGDKVASGCARDGSHCRALPDSTKETLMPKTIDWLYRRNRE